jgi:hypothetical protein
MGACYAWEIPPYLFFYLSLFPKETKIKKTNKGSTSENTGEPKSLIIIIVFLFIILLYIIFFHPTFYLLA